MVDSNIVDITELPTEDAQLSDKLASSADLTFVIQSFVFYFKSSLH